MKEISKNEDSSIICLTESWLTPDVLGSEIKIENFSVYRTDRKSENSKYLHGGVCCYVSDFYSVLSESYSNGVCEVLFLNLTNIATALFTVYC